MNQGGAGAGKTTSIVEMYRPGEMVMCPVRLSTDDTREKLEQKIPLARDRRKYIKTIDSLLANWQANRGKVGRSISVLHGDEVYMARAGFWYASAGLTGVSVLNCYGDEKQIPVVPRVDVAKMYLRVVPDVKVTTYMVYRCAPRIMAVWAGVYDYTLRTPREDKGPCVSVVRSVGDVQIPSKGTVAVIVMYQAEKLEMKKLMVNHIRSPLVGKRLSIMTTHESEGKTFDHSILVNTQVRPCMTDKGYLWGKEDYVLVAASRARDSLTYVRYGTELDTMAKWIGNADDPGMVKAVQDVKSAGTSLLTL